MNYTNNSVKIFTLAAALVMFSVGINATVGPSLNGYGYQVNGTLTVIKNVVGGPLGASNFTLIVYNISSSGAKSEITSFPGSSTGTQVSLSGSYKVGEEKNPNYTTTFSAGCHGTISVGQNVTCTVTNKFNGGHLTVVKIVQGGSLGPSAFTMLVLNNTVANNGTARFSFPGSNKGTTVTFLGIYDVHESSNQTSLSNYTSYFSPGCYGTLYPGRNETCVVINKFKGVNNPAHVTVIKDVVGGPYGPSNFTMNVQDDNIDAHPNISTSFAGSSNGTTVPMLGHYSVYETSNVTSLSNYSVSYSNGCYGYLKHNQSVTCTITNTYKNNTKGVLTVIKKVVGGNFGPSNFTLSVYKDVAPNNHDKFVTSFAGSSSGVNVSINGKYDVDETGGNVSLSKYFTLYSGDCYDTIHSGQQKTCTVTNILKKGPKGGKF